MNERHHGRPGAQARAVALAAIGVAKSYGAVRALNGVDVSVHAGELLTLLGPSGSGKTTLLKAIAGFETIDAGRIVLDGVDLGNLTPARREVGMVFQNYALFPHLTVAENIAFPLRMRSIARSEIDARVGAMLDMVELGSFGTRHPNQLSGGQQQRVALARATVFNPKLLLLDEPFGALDRRLREQMQMQVRAFQRKLGLTTILITHDQEEALTMSDRIAVMRGGEIQQIGTPDVIYRQPSNAFVAGFIGESSMLAGRVEGDGARREIALRSGQRIRVSAPELKDGEEATLLLRPETPAPVRTGQPRPDNVLSGHVVDTVYLGGVTRYTFEADGGLRIVFRRQSGEGEPLIAPGARLDIGWSAGEGHVL